MLSTLNNYRVKYLRWLYGPITDGIREYKIRRHRNALTMGTAETTLRKGEGERVRTMYGFERKK